MRLPTEKAALLQGDTYGDFIVKMPSGDEIPIPQRELDASSVRLHALHVIVPPNILIPLSGSQIAIAAVCCWALRHLPHHRNALTQAVLLLVTGVCTHMQQKEP